MQYIKFGKADLDLSRFGMGCMRFPITKTSTDISIIDEKQSIKMINYAIDNGVNYFDTAYGPRIHRCNRSFCRKVIPAYRIKTCAMATACNR